MLRLTASLLAISVLALAGCASAPPAHDFQALEARLAAKTTASTHVYAGVSPAEARTAANAVLMGIDPRFQVSLTDQGISAARGWSSYLVLANLVGWDYWQVRIIPVEGGTEVFVNATIRSRVPGLLEAAVPPANGFMTEIPLSSEEGLTTEEMDLFQRRMAAKLMASTSWETCETAFGARKGDYPLTCNRGGVTHYF